MFRDLAPEGAGLGVVKAGTGALFTRHYDDRIGHADEHAEHAVGRFEMLETALSVWVAAQAAHGRWTLSARKSFYDRVLPASSLPRFGGAAGGGVGALDHPSSAETVVHGFNDSAQALRWNSKRKGPVKFFLQYERSAYTNRLTPSHEYQAGFLWHLQRTGFGLTVRRFNPSGHHASDALIFTWNLKLS